MVHRNEFVALHSHASPGQRGELRGHASKAESPRVHRTEWGRDDLALGRQARHNDLLVASYPVLQKRGVRDEGVDEGIEDGEDEKEYPQDLEVVVACVEHLLGLAAAEAEVDQMVHQENLSLSRVNRPYPSGQTRRDSRLCRIHDHLVGDGYGAGHVFRVSRDRRPKS